jgi:hypothetical protein
LKSSPSKDFHLQNVTEKSKDIQLFADLASVLGGTDTHLLKEYMATQSRAFSPFFKPFDSFIFFFYFILYIYKFEVLFDHKTNYPNKGTDDRRKMNDNVILFVIEKCKLSTKSGIRGLEFFVCLNN